MMMMMMMMMMMVMVMMMMMIPCFLSLFGRSEMHDCLSAGSRHCSPTVVQNERIYDATELHAGH